MVDRQSEEDLIKDALPELNARFPSLLSQSADRVSRAFRQDLDIDKGSFPTLWANSILAEVHELLVRQPMEAWSLDTRREYVHLTHRDTLMRLRLFKADTKHGGLPYSGHTHARHAMYSQPGLRSFEDLQQDMSGHPILSDVTLIAVWEEIGEEFKITCYKPSNAGSWGSSTPASLMIPLGIPESEFDGMVFENASDDSVMLLPQLEKQEAPNA